jgi:molybdopterin molybdotransferase
MPLAETLQRNGSEREAWYPVRITEGGEVQPVDYHGSAHINALCHTDGFISMPVGIRKIQKGEKRPVRLFDNE